MTQTYEMQKSTRTGKVKPFLHMSSNPCGHHLSLYIIELETGIQANLIPILYDLAAKAKLEMKRGNNEAVQDLLQVFLDVGEKFSKVEKKYVENDKGLEPFAGFSKGLPFTAEGSQ
jgi:hypothetical protein